jgi:hypothetical protein
MYSLFPCPFCGARSYGVISFDGQAIKCEACLAQGPHRDNYEGAVCAWNERSQGISHQALTISKLPKECLCTKTK